jgi:hypothetical protein
MFWFKAIHDQFSVLNTARTEASSMFVSTPVPQRVLPSAVENAGMSEPALPSAIQVCRKSILVGVLMLCKSGTVLARVLDS